jgi:single-strand DNA-binding protein
LLKRSAWHASTTLATTSSWKDRDGGACESTEWHSIVAWGDLAEAASGFRKGDQVYVEGRMKTRSWKDRRHEEVTHYKTEVEARVTHAVARKRAQETP